MFLKIIISVFFSYSTCFSQTGWVKQNSGITSNLNSVYFKNSQTGWCVGDNGIIIKTVNGGIIWTKSNSGTNRKLNSFSFDSHNIAFIAGDSGIILKTTDSGNSWVQLSVPNPYYNFNSVFFVNDSLVFVGGASDETSAFNKIYKTSDQGNTWDSLIVPGSFVKAIFFINPNIGWIIVGNYAIGVNNIYKTLDGGNTWSSQLNITNLYSVFFADSLKGWSTGEGSIPHYLRTTDGGKNWISCFLCVLGPSYSLSFANSLSGWGAGNGVVYHTSNAGVNWSMQNTNHNSIKYYSIHFIDSLTGWVVGDGGTILKTTTGGLTYIANNNSEIPHSYSLSQNYPNPFNPSTNLGFGISDLGFVSLKVYDVLGNEVAVLVNEKKSPGSYEVEWNARDFSSGIYFYSLYIDGMLLDTKRMVLVR